MEHRQGSRPVQLDEEHLGVIDADGRVEVPPDKPGTDEAGIAIDGVLVMLIEPGTDQTANLAHLEKVERLARSVPVAVDGGVTRRITAKCLKLGARYAISGRDLLTVIQPHLENIEKG